MRALLAGACALAIAACNSPSLEPRGQAPVATATASSPNGPSSAAPRPAARGALRVIDATNDSDALSLVRTKRLEARAEKRVLVVLVSATWCEPCQRLEAEIRSGRLDEPLGNVTLLHFDADRDGERLAAAGYAYRFVPYVALPGPDGRPAASQQATERSADAWRELLATLDRWSRAM